MPSTQTRGHWTEYERTGSTGPLVTLVHGGFVDSSAWGRFRTELERFADVVAYDVRGYGQSPSAEPSWPLSTCAADLLALWDALGLDRGWILGFSQGGLIAQLAATMAPERVDGLVLVSTTARFSDEARARFAARAPEVDERTLPEELERHMSMAFSDGFRQTNADALAAYRSVIERVDPRTVANTMRQLAEADHSELLSGIRCPVLVVRGADDPIISEEHVAHLSAGLPDSHAVTLAGTGHNIPLERPGDLARVVEEFVTERKERS